MKSFMILKEANGEKFCVANFRTSFQKNDIRLKPRRSFRMGPIRFPILNSQDAVLLRCFLGLLSVCDCLTV